ncbi:MAG: hypothetical protein TIS_02886 [Tissierella sp.]
MDLDLLLEKTLPLEKSINKTDTLVIGECLDNKTINYIQAKQMLLSDKNQKRAFVS